MAVSAGILLFRRKQDAIEVLLVHPGGPFWENKDEGAWTIPKGEPEPGEDLEHAARREFREETGTEVSGELIELGSVQQKAGKVVHAWAVEGDLDAVAIQSNTFEIEWPPRSGRKQSFPEIDRAEWFGLEEAARRINPAQVELLAKLEGDKGIRG